MDDDVKREQSRLDAGGTADVVVASHLRKVFDDKPKPKVAVSDFTLGCGVGECFGLLGPNGVH
jgi:ABC-type multidrug transport system ATPase subunit